MEITAFIRLVNSQIISYLTEQGYVNIIMPNIDDLPVKCGVMTYKYLIQLSHVYCEHKYEVIPVELFDKRYGQGMSHIDCGTDFDKFKELTKLI